MQQNRARAGIPLVLLSCGARLGKLVLPLSNDIVDIIVDKVKNRNRDWRLHSGGMHSSFRRMR